ncbi:2OG-Fe(II) oxygenase [Larkinella soli]|uniref:2OG-Fe(II) oxygenase n=1 Tax=Larkinella soli TaxID=1770527 RepID=UPI000FFC6441|nr:2OG-Fe(II) oxygenase [Larkinella soli]
MNLETIHTDALTASLNAGGFALLNRILSPSECEAVVGMYDEPARFRKTISMERYRFGLGEYKYLNYPLPDLLQNLREALYPRIVPVANHWMQVLNTGITYPENHADFLEDCRAQGQTLATPLILRYGEGGFNTLHQDLYGDVYFPLQAVVFLNRAGVDYTGGEFVLTEQIPRAQSKAVVLNPGQGDVLIFTTQYRPQKGTRGYYRVAMKHGVSPVRSGRRHTLGIIFHDAK